MDGESRWMWLGLGAATILTYQLLKYQLSEIRRITEVYDDDQDSAEPSKQGSEVLRVASLKTLSESPNYELQQAAIKVVCERILKGKAFKLLLRDISSEKTDTRDRALRGLSLLIENGLMLFPMDDHQHSVIITALVDSMVYMCIDSRNRSPTHQPSNSGHITALYLLYHWLPRYLQDALDAGLVSRWLRFYPFAATNAELQVAVWKLIVEKSPNPISRILCTIAQDARGRKQLVQYGVLNFKLAEAIDPDTRYSIVDSRHREIVVELPLNESGSRAHSGSDEQQRVRRRRREAMVLSDGEHPLESNDIIQRSDELTEENLEAGARALLEITQSQSEGTIEDRELYWVK